MLRAGLAPGPLEPLARHYDWLDRDPDPDGDGLIAILLPDESGLDDSPKYDQVYRWMAHYRPGYFWLVERSPPPGSYSTRAILRALRPSRRGRALQRRATRSPFARSTGMSGEPRFLHRAERAEAALMERCWDERRGLFFDLATRSERRVDVSTWSSLAPFALTALPEEVRRRLAEEHLLDPRRYGAPVGIPSVSMEEPSFRAGLRPLPLLARARAGSIPPGSSSRRFASSATSEYADRIVRYVRATLSSGRASASTTTL